MTGQHQNAEGAFADGHHDVGGDDDLLRRDPVGDYAAEQQEDK